MTNHPPIEPDSKCQPDAFDGYCSKHHRPVEKCWTIEPDRQANFNTESHNKVSGGKVEQDRLDEILIDMIARAEGYKSNNDMSILSSGDLRKWFIPEAKAEIENLYVSKEKVRQALPEKHELLGSNDETNYDIGKSNGYNQAIKDIEGSLGL